MQENNRWQPLFMLVPTGFSLATIVFALAKVLLFTEPVTTVIVIVTAVKN